MLVVVIVDVVVVFSVVAVVVVVDVVVTVIVVVSSVQLSLWSCVMSKYLFNQHGSVAPGV